MQAASRLSFSEKAIFAAVSCDNNKGEFIELS